ncbi:hypothetical protein COLU111180_04290 [Cohnella lubricantis]|uniref:HNH endonuclease n=1 Tax=Cohnella lubricantis TaxID=2163172 RepID=A0A841T583_9BACL|nr:hypothetical protein [Cohnella lubricantis]MBB6676474.1 hypothetical protein [Cohnella lubricantis]MBP2117091.1 hypothetical protein [Cohnella lubricantis]
MPIGDFNPYPKEKQLFQRRTKPTQRQMGEISPSVDRELKDRSGYVCEVRKRCSGARATQRAHTKGRRTIPRKTAVDDLFHACVGCHIWMDETPEGIRFKRQVREIGGTTVYLQQNLNALGG